MEQGKECISVEQAATNYALNNHIYPQTLTSESSFKAGAQWQKEQYINQDKTLDALIQALHTIAAWPGNLPDEQYMTKTGPNDAAQRGGMVVAMRAIAKETLKKLKIL